MLKRGLCAWVVYLMLALSLGSNSSKAGAAFGLRASPTAGSLFASPPFATIGVDTTVLVTGSGWETFPEECQYDLLFDGVKKAQQGPDLGLFTQPNMTFTVPGTTTEGIHTITVVLVGTHTGRRLPRDLPFEVVCDGLTFDDDVITKTRTVGTNSIRDVGDKKKDTKETLKDEILAGLKDAGANVDDPAVQKDAEESAKKAVSDKLDAVTHTCLSVSWSFTTDKDGKVCAAKVTYRDFVVTLLPANAGTQLKNHEDGHVLIRKLLKDHAKTKFEAAFGEAKGKTVAEANKIFEQTRDSINKLGEKAGDSYDKTTKDGTEGGENQQEIAKDAFMKEVEKSEKKK